VSVSILVLCELSQAHRDILLQRYRPHFAVTPEQRQAAVRTCGAAFEAVLTLGLHGLRADEMDAMPQLRLIACLGAGHEGVDLAAARARGIVVSNGRGANDECAADHAMGLW